MRSREKEIFYRILAVALSAVLTFSFCEVGAYLWITYGLSDSALMSGELKAIERNSSRYVPHPYLNYFNDPKYKQYASSREVESRHNPLGFRGVDVALEKSKNSFRIVVLGGSAVYSPKVVRDSKTIPASLAAYLADHYLNVEVVNAGVNGYSTAEALILLQFKILDLKPDLVIVYEAINDLHNRYVPPELFHADNSGRIKPFRRAEFPWWTQSFLLRTLGYFTGHLRQNLFLDYYLSQPEYLGHTADDRTTKDTDYVELLKKNTTLPYQRNLESIVAICRAHNINVVLTSYGYSLDYTNPLEPGFLKTKNYLMGLKEMNETSRRVAQALHVPYFDYESKMPKTKSYWRDEVHVSAEGAALTGALFGEFLMAQRLVPTP